MILYNPTNKWKTLNCINEDINAITLFSWHIEITFRCYSRWKHYKQMIIIDNHYFLLQSNWFTIEVLKRYKRK